MLLNLDQKIEASIQNIELSRPAKDLSISPKLIRFFTDEDTLLLSSPLTSEPSERKSVEARIKSLETKELIRIVNNFEELLINGAQQLYADPFKVKGLCKSILFAAYGNLQNGINPAIGFIIKTETPNQAISEAILEAAHCYQELAQRFDHTLQVAALSTPEKISTLAQTISERWLPARNLNEFYRRSIEASTTERQVQAIKRQAQREDTADYANPFKVIATRFLAIDPQDS